jgi:hypothetical protein
MVLVYSRRKLQKAHCSSTRAVPVLVVLARTVVFSVEYFVRLRHCGHLA